jgi:hypothetical protein
MSYLYHSTIYVVLHIFYDIVSNVSDYFKIISTDITGRYKVLLGWLYHIFFKMKNKSHRLGGLGDDFFIFLSIKYYELMRLNLFVTNEQLVT